MNKNKSFIILLIIIVGITVGAFYYFNTQNSNNGKQNNYEVTKTSTNNNSNYNANGNSDYVDDDNQENENSVTADITEQPTSSTETTLSTFSTKIYTTDSARQNNINITCGSLNDTIVKNGETFSFCSTVGQATSAKGYQKADIFDKNGNKKKGLRWWKLPS
ncbi:MAG: VanW family protein [Clostridia bacterium]|nr:VanW family protein [Clostridia bacterium]